jgi:acylpyruvate hydrolase
MKLATLRTGKGTTTAALAVGAESYAPLPYSNIGELLADPGWRSVVHTEASAAEQDAKLINASDVELGPLLPTAGKVICCGLNYGDHIQEMGRELPEYPTLFAKSADTLTGPTDVIEVQGSGEVDWEAELAVVVGSHLYRADEEQAGQAIAGYTVANDISMRDWQKRTLQWFQGKAFDAGRLENRIHINQAGDATPQTLVNATATEE